MLTRSILFMFLFIGVTPWIRAVEAPAEVFTATETAQMNELNTKLEKPVTVEMPEVSVERALEILSRRAEVKFMLVGRENRDNYRRTVNMTLDGARAVDVLKVICESANLKTETRPGFIRISSVQDTPGRDVKFFAYAINDLTSTIPDFQPPSGAMGLQFEGSSGTSYAAAANPFAAAGTFTTQTIAEMIRNRIRPNLWDPGLGTSIEERGGVLIVMQTEEVHALIRKLLTGLRARQSRQVGIEVKLYEASSVEIDKLREAAMQRGANRMHWDDAAQTALEQLAGAGKAKQVFVGSSVIYNTQMGLIRDLKSTRLLCGYELSGDAYAPEMKNVYSGTVVSALPVLSDDGKLVSVSLRLAYLQLAGAPEAMVVLRNGMATNSLGTSGKTIHIKRKDTPPDEKDKKQPPAPEYEVTTTEAGGMFPTAGPLQVQLPGILRSRISQDLMLPGGQWTAISAPLGDAEGAAIGREMLALIRCTPYAAADQGIDPEWKDIAEVPAVLKERLNTKITLNLLETPFRRAIEAFSQQAKLPIAIDWTGLADKVQSPVTFDAKDMRAGDALTLIMRAADADFLSYPSLLWVTSKRTVSAKRMTLRVFDIRDMTADRSDYPAEQGYNDDRTTGPIANAFAAAPTGDFTARLKAADFQAIIAERLMAPEFTDPATAITESGGKLVVVQTPEAMLKIEQLLKEMRATGRRPILLTARCGVMDAADLKTAIGNELPQIVNAAAALKAIQVLAAPNSKDISAARLFCFNGQRVSAFGGVERPLVMGYEVSGASYSPIIRSVLGGMTLDVQPMLLEGSGADAKSNQLRLETRFRLTRLEAKPAQMDMLAPGADGKPVVNPPLVYPGTPGKIHEPVSDTLATASTVRVDDGGAVIFRFPVPSWLADEKAEDRNSGKRIAVLILRAEQLKE